MTKDEILKDNGAHLHDEAYQYSGDTEDLRTAMDEYAKQECIAFAEWAAINLWTYDRDEDTWSKIDIFPYRYLATEELYVRFLTDREK